MAVKSSFKNMTICLTAICLVCSALLAGVYVLTEEPINEAKIAKNDAAIKSVLPDTAVDPAPEATVMIDGANYTYNIVKDKDGNKVGCAINVSAVGFGGPIEIKVGFDVAKRVIHNTKVLSQSETPGLGAKCADPKEKFVAQFKGFDPFKENAQFKFRKDGGQLDAITASTITSRAYVDALAIAVKVFEHLFPAKAEVAQEQVVESAMETVAEDVPATGATLNKEE